MLYVYIYIYIYARMHVRRRARRRSAPRVGERRLTHIVLLYIISITSCANVHNYLCIEQYTHIVTILLNYSSILLLNYSSIITLLTTILLIYLQYYTFILFTLYY